MLLNKVFLQKLRTGFFVLERSFFCFFSRVSELIQMRQRSPWLWNDTLYGLLPSGREHKKCLKVLHDFTNKVITINNNNDNNGNDDDGDEDDDDDDDDDGDEDDDDDDDEDDDDVDDLMCVRDLASSVFAYSQKSFIVLFCSSDKLALIFSLKDRPVPIENDKLLTFDNFFPSL